MLTVVSMPKCTAPLFRAAVVEQTTTVQVGYMSKPMAALAVTHGDGLFIHVTMSLEWICRAVTGLGRARSPLKGGNGFFGRLQQVTPALAEEEVDPMEELKKEGGVCAGGHPNESQDFETPKKRSRKHLTQAELEFVSHVPLVDVIDDIKLFQATTTTPTTTPTATATSERDRVAGGSLRILFKTNRRRQVFVHEQDLGMFMLVLLRHVERMGVPIADLPDNSSALAEESEWFDPVTSRWHLRVGTSDEVIRSDPVRRVNREGRALGEEAFKSGKTAVLRALKEQSQGYATP